MLNSNKHEIKLLMNSKIARVNGSFGLKSSKPVIYPANYTADWYNSIGTVRNIHILKMNMPAKSKSFMHKDQKAAAQDVTLS